MFCEYFSHNYSCCIQRERERERESEREGQGGGEFT
jgi:hypothetical protein